MDREFFACGYDHSGVTRCFTVAENFHCRHFRIRRLPDPLLPGVGIAHFEAVTVMPGVECAELTAVAAPSAVSADPTSPQGFCPTTWSPLACPESKPESAVARLEQLAFAHGNLPVSYDIATSNGLTLETPCGGGVLRIWPDGRFWHVAGGIIAADGLKRSVVHWLRRISDQQKRTIAVYSVPAEEARLYRDAGFAVNKFGEEPFLDLGALNWEGKAFEWVRRQSNYCRRQGLEVVEPTQPQAENGLAEELMSIQNEDLRSRVFSKPLRLLEGEFNPLNLQRSRLFVAQYRNSGRTEGFVAARPMDNGRAWAFETYRKRSDSPRGTIPFLFREVIDRLQLEGVHSVSLCLVPGKGVQHDKSAEADRRIRWLLSLWYGRLGWLFNATGQDYFKSRFRARYVDRFLCVYPGNSLTSFASFLRTTGALAPDPGNLCRILMRQAGGVVRSRAHSPARQTET